MNFKRLIRILIYSLLFSLLYINYLIFLDEVNPDQGERYAIHAEDGAYYCENIQKVSLDLVGYHCNGKYPVVEFRSPHVVVHRGDGE